MNPIDLITAEDRIKIEKYIREFVDYPGYRWCGIEQYLRFWNDAKSKHLFELFGHQLRISVPVEYKIDKDELEQLIRKMLRKDEEARNFYNAMHDLFSHWSNEYDAISILLNSWTLAQNKVEIYRDDMSVPLKDGKVLKIRNGSRPLRSIRKIAESYDIEGFEHFMNKHSECLNQKSLKGTVHMSIHPMDYMTMSDNNEGWESCMSWSNDGCYKQGTVEMMNSPCAVVGYLESDSRRFEFGWDDDVHASYTWNSKKWRSLFLVDPDFIINVKQYPYFNDNLVSKCVSLLAERAGWGEVELRKFEHCRNNSYADRQVYIRFETGAMYNDFGCGHFLALNPEIEGDYYCDGYCYSGNSMCVWCGGTHDIGDEGEESCLLCGSCDSRRRCDCCGRRICSDEDTFWVGEDCLCGNCWDNCASQDEITGEACYDSEMITLYLNRNYNETDFFNYTWKCMTIRTHESMGDWHYRWSRYFNIKEPRVFKQKCYWGGTQDWFYINVEDCTKEGLSHLWGLYNEDDVAQYLAEA